MFTILDLNFVRLNDTNLLDLMEKYSGSLIELRLGCHELTPAAYPAISQCVRLRRLYLDRASNLHLEKIVRVSLDLETIDLREIDSVRNDGFAYILVLEKLRHLRLIYAPGTSGTALRGLGRIYTLQYLDLGCTYISDACIRSIASSLTDLRTLELCPSFTVNSKSFDIICRTFTKLERLQLGSCSK